MAPNPNISGPQKREYSVDQKSFRCRCTIGEDHLDASSSWGESRDEDDDPAGFAGDEEIWLSSGMDEDYDFRPLKDR